ncbi:MAG: SynChlorMet cassette radical SAM/SPASM protein ScmE [Candidatus Eremiobacterota bacterium]
MKIMNTPREVDLSITNKCNLRCKYCFHFTGEGDTGNELRTEEWLKFFKELNDCAVLELCISGGEPFCRNDLKELIDGIIKNRMRFSILSNGTLITEEWAAFLYSTKRCNYVQVSIDGSIPITHDSFRGKGNFKRSVEGIKNLRKYNVSTTVRVTIHKKNVHDLENIAKLLLEDIGIPSISTNSASYMGLCRQYTDEIMLSTEERTLAMEQLLLLEGKYRGRISATAGPLAEGRIWLEMEKNRQEKKGPVPGRGYLTGCSGAMSRLAVRADGIIVPCAQIPGIELGRINKDSLVDIWQNHPALNKFRNRCEIPLKQFEYCAGCEYINYCTGSCPALAYTTFGNDEHPGPDACIKRFLEEGGKLPFA